MTLCPMKKRNCDDDDDGGGGDYADLRVDEQMHYYSNSPYSP